jgi:hypothetical protein
MQEFHKASFIAELTPSDLLQFTETLNSIEDKYYAILTEFNDGNPTLSDSRKVEVKAPPPPKLYFVAPITNQTANVNFTLYWVGSDLVTSYTIYMSSSPITPQDRGSVVKSGLTTTSVLVTGLAPGKYYFAVESFNLNPISTLSDSFIIYVNSAGELFLYPEIPIEDSDDSINETDAGLPEDPFELIEIALSGGIVGIMIVIYRLWTPTTENSKSALMHQKGGKYNGISSNKESPPMVRNFRCNNLVYFVFPGIRYVQIFGLL